MISWIQLLGFLCFLGIAVEDFTSRQIHVAWFTCCFLLSGVGLWVGGENDRYIQVWMNLSFVLGIGVIAIFYVRLRFGMEKWKKSIGLGDFLMLFVLCFWLRTATYIGFFWVSVWISALSYGLYIYFTGRNFGKYAIPMAGIWAVGSMVIQILEIVIGYQNLLLW